MNSWFVTLDMHILNNFFLVSKCNWVLVVLNFATFPKKLFYVSLIDMFCNDITLRIQTHAIQPLSLHQKNILSLLHNLHSPIPMACKVLQQCFYPYLQLNSITPIQTNPPKKNHKDFWTLAYLSLSLLPSPSIASRLICTNKWNKVEKCGGKFFLACAWWKNDDHNF